MIAVPAKTKRANQKNLILKYHVNVFVNVSASFSLKIGISIMRMTYCILKLQALKFYIEIA